MPGRLERKWAPAVQPRDARQFMGIAFSSPFMGAAGRAKPIWLVVLLGLATAGFLAAWFAYGWDPIRTGDGWNYLAAGERLNAGHALYALVPGDRPVVIVPPYWTVPLRAPPPIAVAWRSLALLGEASLLIWALGAIPATAWAMTRASVMGWALLAAPVTMTALSGNASAFVVASFILVGCVATMTSRWVH